MIILVEWRGLDRPALFGEHYFETGQNCFDHPCFALFNLKYVVIIS